MKYYECKTRVEMAEENGKTAEKRFSYLVQADSCKRAEELVMAEYEHSNALAKVTDVVGRKFDELIVGAADAIEPKFYKIGYTITTIDERKGFEFDKKEAALVAAEILTDAVALLFDKFDKSMHKPVLLSVVETPIVEFIKDTNEETTDA
jgi:hypothetical protein